MEDTQIRSSSWFQKKPSLAVFFIVIVLGIIGIGVPFIASQQNPSDSQNGENTENETDSAPPVLSHLPYTIVYGTWANESSYIKAFNLQTSTQYLLAEFPDNIKQVSFLADGHLLYINDLDTKDYGKSIMRYDIQSKESTVVFSASSGYAVSTYLLSPEKRYMAVWTVAFSENTSALTGGSSQVYTVDLQNPSTPHLIYSDVGLSSSNPAHYPVAITNSGDVYVDTFVPNTIRGWAHGMAKSSFDGSVKTAIPTMANGTYASQPVMSPNGLYIAFVGYSGKDGDGTTIRGDGFRQAFFSSDTMELLDLQTLQRTKLDDLSTSHVYYPPTWDSSSDVIYFPQVGSSIDESGMYSYHLVTKQIKKMNLSPTQSLVQNITPDDILIGVKDESKSATGKLGAGYFSPFLEFSVLNSSTNLSTKIPLPDSMMQYIETVPSDEVLALNLPQGTGVLGCDGKDNLQLCTLALEPTLFKKKVEQENDPIPTPGDSPTNSCIMLAGRQCQAKGFAGEELKACIKVTSQALRAEGDQCSVSPLYLYGPEGKKVTVTVHTPTWNEQPSFDKTLSITLEKNDSIKANGSLYESLAFDYTPAIHVGAPQYGTIAKRKDLAQTLTEYGEKLGLTKKEIRDLRTTTVPQITSEYVFVSYYDHEVSKYILPLSFDPQPDTYINIVFYLRPLGAKPIHTPQAPTFKTYVRTGFTAVEISSIIVK